MQARSARYVAPTVGLGALAFVVAWVAYKAVGDTATFIIISLNGLTFAGLYFVVASGFTLVFGLMRVVNMAHGSLYLLGGYFALELERAGAGWLAALAVASLSMGVIGLVMQQLFLRWNQGQDLRQALITIALSVILADQMLDSFGGQAEDIRMPGVLEGAVDLGVYGLAYPNFRLIVLGVGLTIGLALWIVMKRTKIGAVVRAGVDDRQMVSALGINIQLVFGIAFFAGSLLAGAGGVFGGTMIALAPGEDTAILLNSLVVVIIGGMGSLGGAAIGALALGLVSNYAQIYLPGEWTTYSILLTFALLVFVLAVRPLGLFGRPA